MKLKELWDKVSDFFIFKNNCSEGIIEEDNINRDNKRVVSIYKNQEFKIMIHHPHTYDEVKDIAVNLKAKKPVIINLEGIDRDIARRVIDFLSGAVYSLNGNIQKIGDHVFLFTPEDIKIDGDLVKNNLERSLVN